MLAITQNPLSDLVLLVDLVLDVSLTVVIIPLCYI